MNLQPATLDKLGKLFPRLASDHDGEVVATARAIIRTLESAGSSLHDLGGFMQPRTVERIIYREKAAPRAATPKAKPKPKPKKKAAKPSAPKPDYSADNVPYEEILEFADRLIDDCDLNAWEVNFVSTLRATAAMYGSAFFMSAKQTECWRAMLVKHKIVGDAA